MGFFIKEIKEGRMLFMIDSVGHDDFLYHRGSTLDILKLRITFFGFGYSTLCSLFFFFSCKYLSYHYVAKYESSSCSTHRMRRFYFFKKKRKESFSYNAEMRSPPNCLVFGDKSFFHLLSWSQKLV